LDSLTYTFNAENGCSNIIGNTVEVNPAPVANAGPDLCILKGSAVLLNGLAIGKDLYYY
jgi:hypothetical protein